MFSRETSPHLSSRPRPVAQLEFNYEALTYPGSVVFHSELELMFFFKNDPCCARTKSPPILLFELKAAKLMATQKVSICYKFSCHIAGTPDCNPCQANTQLNRPLLKSSLHLIELNIYVQAPHQPTRTKNSLKALETTVVKYLRPAWLLY